MSRVTKYELNKRDIYLTATHYGHESMTNMEYLVYARRNIREKAVLRESC